MAPPTEGSTTSPRATAPEPLPLDWTQLGEGEALPVRFPADVTDITPDEDDICIVGTAGQKITFIGSDFSSTVNENMTSLVLRSHLIHKMEGLQHFKCLDLLELYDNQIPELACLDEGEEGKPGNTLRVLDMSYNVIREMQPVSLCPNLQELCKYRDTLHLTSSLTHADSHRADLANNKLKDMSGLKELTKLRKLDLGANRIREMVPEELSGLVNLEELWLGKNKIEKIDGLSCLKKLRRLDIQSNRLERIENLEAQKETLEELYLAHNGIEDSGIISLDLTNISVLDFCRNRLTSARHFAHLVSLEELWLSGNNIANFSEVEPLVDLSVLETIYLEYNPVQKENPLYRKRLTEIMAPSLRQIDATPIGHQTTSTILSPEEQNRHLQDLVLQRAAAQNAQEEKTLPPDE